jgi:translation initiation factor 2B subunit (eIF-2B alpha/beta/delta family)
LFRDYVNKNKWSDARELFNTVRTMGKKLISADKMNFTVGNIVKRVYHVIREECNNLKISIKDTSSLTQAVPKSDLFRMDSLTKFTTKKKDKTDDEDKLELIEEELDEEDISPKKIGGLKRDQSKMYT